MGQLETGVNKNLAQTQESINKSTADYQSNLQNIDKDYSYKGQEDLSNINQPETFSRLSSLVSPGGAQSRLAGVSSNTANYRPDTQGVAQASTMGGLSAQLRNQYGTSEGGSRLDALLYRGGGQAGQAINKGLDQINTFNLGQQQQLGQESNLLKQLQQGAVDKSARLKSEGVGYQGQLQSEAAKKAQEVQAKYDTARAAGGTELQNIIKNTDYQKQLREAIDSAFYSPQASNIQGGTGTQRQLFTDIGTDRTKAVEVLMSKGIDEASAKEIAKSLHSGPTKYGPKPGKYDEAPKIPTYKADITEYTRNRLADEASKKIDMSQFKPESYLGEARNFNPDVYLDPRYNMIGQLLGTNQIAGATNPSDVYSQDNAKLQADIAAYLSPQVQQAREAANAVFNPVPGVGYGAGTPTFLKDLLASPATGVNALGGLGSTISSWF